MLDGKTDHDGSGPRLVDLSSCVLGSPADLTLPPMGYKYLVVTLWVRASEAPSYEIKEGAIFDLMLLKSIQLIYRIVAYMQKIPQSGI